MLNEDAFASYEPGPGDLATARLWELHDATREDSATSASTERSYVFSNMFSNFWRLFGKL